MIETRHTNPLSFSTITTVTMPRISRKRSHDDLILYQHSFGKITSETKQRIRGFSPPVSNLNMSSFPSFGPLSSRTAIQASAPSGSHTLPAQQQHPFSPPSLSPPFFPTSPSQRSVTSGADSFVTAREDPWDSSDDEIDIGNSRHPTDVNPFQCQNQNTLPAREPALTGRRLPRVTDPQVAKPHVVDPGLSSTPTQFQFSLQPETPPESNRWPNSLVVPKKRQSDAIVSTSSSESPAANSSKHSSLQSTKTTRRTSQDDISPRKFSNMSSASSSTSTVIESYIVSTPRKVPKLRHVTKTDTLRNYMDSTFDYSPPQSARSNPDSSPGSKGIPSVQNYRSRTSRVVTEPTLKHQPHYNSLRATRGDAGITPLLKNRSAPLKQPNFTPSSSFFPIAPPLSIPISQVARNRKPLNRPSSRHSPRNLAQAFAEKSLVSALANASISAASPNGKSRHGFEDAAERKKATSPVRTPFRSERDRSYSDASGRSFSATRRSLDRVPTTNIDKDNNPRQLIPLLSPLSLNSSLELSEATAVPFYPHNNDSLVFIQEVGSNTAQQPEQMNTDPVETPSIEIRPATADEDDVRAVMTTPLQHPRQPPPLPLTRPNLPEINIQPATPLSSIGDIDPLQRHTTKPSKPIILQRARQYSDSLPAVIRRSFSLRGRSQRQSSGKDRPVSVPTRRKLSPSWRPRNFLEEGNDDNDDNDSNPEPFDRRIPRRLPAGGDTSEHPRISLSRRLGQRLSEYRGRSLINTNTVTAAHHRNTYPSEEGDQLEGFAARLSSLPQRRKASPTAQLGAAGPASRSQASLKHSVRSEAEKRRRKGRPSTSAAFARFNAISDKVRSKVNEIRHRSDERRKAELKQSIGPPQPLISLVNRD